MIRGEKIMSPMRHEILAEKLRFNNYFKLEYTSLYVFGFDYNCREQPFYKRWLSYSSTFSLGLLMCGMFHYSYSHIPNVTEVSEGLTPFVQVLMALSKFFVLVIKGPDIVDMVQRIWSFTDRANADELEIIRATNERAFLINITYCGLVAFTAVFTTAGIPIIGFLFLLIRGKFLYKVMLVATYPIDLEKPLNYFLIYLWTNYAVFAVALITAGVDSSFSWCAQNIAGLFYVVQHKIEMLSKVCNATVNGNGNDNNDRILRKAIVECINYHEEIIRLAVRLDQVFQKVGLIVVSLNSFQICLLMYQFDSGFFSDIFNSIFLVGFLGIVLVQMLMFSHCGQRLEDESENVAISAFHCIDWENWKMTDIKTILLIILRSQRPCRMTAIFFYLKMALFISVVQTAGSYKALLRSIQD